MSSEPSSSTPLKLEVFVAPPIPVAFQPPRLPAEFHFEWSPMAATLIWGPTEAILVDALMTDAQGDELGAWIAATAPGVALKYIFITHGHGDHAFGATALRKRFPDAKVIGSPGTVAHMVGQVDPRYFAAVLGAWFPGQISIDNFLDNLHAIPLGPDGGLTIDGQAVEIRHAGQADTYDSSYLWVPSIRAVVAGDIVYNGVHQMVSESNNTALRKQWADAVREIAKLDPAIVVSGHTRPGNTHGPETLASTIEYLDSYSRFTEESATAEELFWKVVRKYPERMNPAMVWIGSQSQEKFKAAPAKA